MRAPKGARRFCHHPGRGGFLLSRVVSTASPFSVIEGKPA
jgi:hypothetical protein